MTRQLDTALERLVKESQADAALVWSRVGRTGGALVLGAYPATIPAGPVACLVPDGADPAATDLDRQITEALPGALLRELPAAPVATRSFAIGEDLNVTVIWCDPSTRADLAEERERQALDEVGAIAQLCRDLHFAEGDIERLRAVVNGLQDGVVMVNPALSQAALNQSAATLLGLPQGMQPESDFDGALANLGRRAVNRNEFNSCITRVASDPAASIECMWFLTGNPSHVLAVSKPVQHGGFRGRIWVFYNESRSQQARESLEYAHELLRASADGMLDPQALLEAVRDPAGQIMDFTYRDVNNATCAYLGMARDELIGHSLLKTMPNVKSSGMLDLFAQCADTHQPLVLDDALYDNQILTGPRRYDIRANHVGGDFITLTWRDVTERVHAAERIAQTESRFRLLAENVGDVVMHVREDVIAWVSPSVEAALGAPPEHWVGKKVWDIIPEEDRGAHEKVTWLTDERAVIPRGRIAAADGTVHWVHVHAKAFYDADGRPDGYTSSFRVIDDEMHAMESAESARLKQANADARYRRLMDSSPVAMCVADAEGRFEVVNDAMCRFFGYDAEAMRAKNWRELVVPEALDAELKEYGSFIAGDVDYQRSMKQCLTATGGRVWGDFSISCVRAPDGKAESFITQIIDITEQMQAHQAAENARQERARADARYRRLMDNSAVGMCMVTPDGRFETVNPALCEFFGYDAETLKTKTWQELTAGDSLERDLRNADDMLAGRIDHYRLTKQYIHADGHLIWADLSVSCVRDARGQVEFFVSQIVDITAEVENKRQIAQRDQQNRALAQRLQSQTDRLRSELKVAGDYVNSLLPGDLDGPVRVSQYYLPSRELGGDCFDYRWIDDDNLLIYLIDVSGHGIAPALESISVHNLLRSGSLPRDVLSQPAEVLAELNAKFPMDQHGGNYFTLWYGVYQMSTRTLRYASAGHPPALVFTDPAADPVRLSSPGLPVGMFADTVFTCEGFTVPDDAEIVLYSDGAFEFPVPEGASWSLSDFVTLCTAQYGSGDWSLEDLARRLQARTVAGLFSDDCSLLRLRFPGS